MAKHRKKSRRRRSVGALDVSANNPLVTLVSIGVGLLAGDQINDTIDKINIKKVAATATTPATTTNRFDSAKFDTMALVGEGGLGALLLLSKKKNAKSPVALIETVGGGMLVGAAVRRGLKKAGIIGGYQSVPVIGRRMAGYQQVPVIGGNMPSILNGNMPSTMNGYRVNGYTPNGSGAPRVMGSVGNPLEGAIQQMGCSGYMN